MFKRGTEYFVMKILCFSFSAFSITFNENQSRIYVDSTHAEEFKALLVIPTKPPGNFLSVNDILENGLSLKGQFVNTLVAVREVRNPFYFSKAQSFINEIKIIKF